MKPMQDEHTLPVLTSDDAGHSIWASQSWPVEAHGGMLLSQRIDCTSLRLRRSEPGYTADWHVAGEAVLIVVQRGGLRIGLRDGATRDFLTGDAFIAADRVPEGQAFDPARHGHTAAVIGDEALQAVHIKIAPPLG